MSKKIRVGILFGGRSAEHEVSLQSAKNVIEAIDREKYEVVLIGIDKQGGWHLHAAEHFLLNAANPESIRLSDAAESLAVVPEQQRQQKFVSLSGTQPVSPIDVVFPILHGTYGEDGTVQGLLKLADLPFVGAGVLGSAVGMDKDLMKRLLRDAGIPIAKFMTVHQFAKHRLNFEDVVEQLRMPCFIKPANMGSSVGVSKAHNQEEFERAIAEAFEYDRKIVIEEFIQGREIECSVLGNDDPIASLPGEVIPAPGKHQFYSYQSKYLDEHGAALEVPAKLPEYLVKKVQETSIKAFKVLCCEGMARVDGFLTADECFVVNEINTIPGFTKISMYPKLWEVSGISYTELIDRLLQLALERYEKEKHLKTNFF